MIEKRVALILLLLPGVSVDGLSSTIIPADDPNIQYYGRWDCSDPAAPTHSWPGVYIVAEFEGTSIGVRMNDNFCYYNVIIDDTVTSVFHPDVYGLASYTLATGLEDGRHSILLTERNESNWGKFSFNGFVLDDGKTLLPPPPKPARKIEFIGDSYTVASGNEWINDSTSPSGAFTNVYEGFGPMIARHYGAQYQITAFSGWGLVLDWKGNPADNLPEVFDRTLACADLPKWDFRSWIPDLVVICLGLNDYNGWGGYAGLLPDSNKEVFESRYRLFIGWIRQVYSGTRILAVAAHPEWIRDAVHDVVTRERAAGKKDVSFTWFPYYPGGYVNKGHPNVETHRRIADRLIAAIDSMDVWRPELNGQ